MSPRRAPLGLRSVVLLAILAGGISAAAALGLPEGGVGEGGGGLRFAGEFFSRALSPALGSEEIGDFGGTPILPQALDAARATVVFAAAALSLALAVGFLLGFLGSTAWWAGNRAGGSTRSSRLLRRTVAPAIYWPTRVLIALMRSIHELLWAVLFLAAFGLNNVTAVIAIAIPYAGILAKVFSEVIDEAPRGPALALRATGASSVQVFAFGLLPAALPDLAAYTLYRFECALRSSAVLGFFGFPTLGYYISASFENSYYGEVWTYLYTLLALILVVEWWSWALRRRTGK